MYIYMQVFENGKENCDFDKMLFYGLGCKTIDEDDDSKREVTREEAENFFGQFNPPIPYIEVSVRNNEEVTRLFREKASLWINQFGSALLNGNQEQVKPKIKENKEKKDCIIC